MLARIQYLLGGMAIGALIASSGYLGLSRGGIHLGRAAEKFQSEFCAELDLRVVYDVDPKAIWSMRPDFEKFITEAINRCTEQKAT